jgi:hypothetical protein
MTQPIDLHIRDAPLFASLREILGASLPRAPALARQLAGFDIASLQARADLTRLPVLRKSDLTVVLRQKRREISSACSFRPARYSNLRGAAKIGGAPRRRYRPPDSDAATSSSIVFRTILRRAAISWRAALARSAAR